MKPIHSGVLVLLILVSLAGCRAYGDKLLGFPPRVELESLRLAEDSDRIELVVLVFNPNDVALEIESLQLEFSLDEQPGLQFQRTLLMDIGARNRERIRLTGLASDALVERLQSLAASGADPLPYTMLGELAVAGARAAPVRTRDFLHPTPGQPNRFR